jgi:hypothetical protein
MSWLRMPVREEWDPSTKPLAYVPVYEELLAPLREAEPFALLELGVWTGESLQMWRDAFPQATIVGVDLNHVEVDLGPRVHFEQGDQSDAAFLTALRERHAPQGFELIVDDASHQGELSARSMQHLFGNHLRPGGLYVLEDWGTGYLASWPDGGPYDAPLDVSRLDQAEPGRAGDRRMPSHDSGMVGLVKRLVDHTARATIEYVQAGSVGDALAIESMTVRDGILALRKARG